ncbi:MAG: GIY-YIG nuclease family protein [Symploca sp. SIO2G7]|nr:GIY-YIG nuclease family protein [Symploca sp. SIO2G7]
MEEIQHAIVRYSSIYSLNRLEEGLIHYAYDSSLSKCAIALMDAIVLNPRQLMTRSEIENLSGWGSHSKNSAKKLLVAGGYIKSIYLNKANSTKGWQLIKTHRQKDEIHNQQKSPYWYLPSNSEKRNKGFVYVFRRIRDGLYKIGITDDLRKRASQVANRCGSHLELAIALDSDEFNVIEVELHDCFEHKRTVGEWFVLDTSDIIRIDNFFKELTEDGDIWQ